jgi:YbbR domain-containing protein
VIDRLMDNPWFLRIISLVLAVLLFSSVPEMEKAKDENVPAQNNVETIADVPVKSYYDIDNLVVSGVPDTVDVTIQGPKSIVQTTKSLRNFEVFVDLSDAEIGTQRVPIQIRDISDKLKVTVKPSYANVTIQERVTKEFNVEAEFNKNLLEDGYISEHPIVEPNKVKITGAKDVIERIHFVIAALDIEGLINSTVTREATIQALDKELNKLDVMIDPETVTVTVPVKSSSKTVPIKIVQKGTPPEGVSINSISIDVKEATIFAKPEVLDQTESVRVEVDVSKIQKDTELTLPVIISEGISKVDPETITARINVDANKVDTNKEDEKKEEQKTLSNLPINTEGLNEQYEVAFQDPASATADLTIIGSSDIIRGLSEDDFSLFINVSNLSKGNHELDIQVNGPNSVKWKLAKEKAKISITEKEEA